MLNKRQYSRYIKPLDPLKTDLEPFGRPRKQIKVILFDIYGTLFISGSGDISIAKKETKNNKDFEALLTKYHIKKKPKKIIKNFFEHIKNRHEELKKTGTDYPEVDIDMIWMEVLETVGISAAREFAVEYELIANPVYPMPHLKEMLAACRANNIRLGLISNAQFYTPYLFSWFLGKPPEETGFDEELTFYSYRLGHAKPSMLLYQFAAAKLKESGISPHSVLYVGNDMLNDIYPAQITGFQTALFAGDSRSLRLREDEERCEDIEPDMVITDLMQIVEFI